MKTKTSWPRIRYVCAVGSMALLNLRTLSPSAAEPNSTPEAKPAAEIGPSVLQSPLAEVLVREAVGLGLQQLHDAVAPADETLHYGLAFDPGAIDGPHDRPIALLVHGFHSTPNNVSALLSQVRPAGVPCGTFAYPYNQTLGEAAEFLSHSLKKFAADHAGRRLALVTHSMGGLVARECLENSALDPGNIDRLIMVAPPSQGTLLAQAAAARPVGASPLGGRMEALFTPLHDVALRRLFAATEDLTPGSDFLLRLNGRQRHPDVKYSLFLGSGAAITDAEMRWIRVGLRAMGKRLPRLHPTAGKFDDLLADMDEVLAGKGDGVVAVKRGMVAGVTDVTILPFDHVEVAGPALDAATERVQLEVLARLR